MHIPPYHKKPSWQRFLIGIVIGGIIAYCIVIFMYGAMYERLLEQNLDLQSQVTELKNQNEALLEDKEDLDEKAKEPLVINTVEVKITNEEQLRLDRLIIHQLEEMVKQEISHVIGQDINVIDKSDQLLISTIENKGFTVDDFTYYFDVSKLTISQTVKLTVEAKVSN
ncbi:sporulation membrane protein YtrI [Virgibacillus byunsanensis]|uniref:Sporulation membrane protein YtrI n=1 Tax=Virgibacillus byunsanensis TaxID=570945 RepID=A0ABW3LJ85_9BACI